MSIKCSYLMAFLFLDMGIRQPLSFCLIHIYVIKVGSCWWERRGQGTRVKETREEKKKKRERERERKKQSWKRAAMFEGDKSIKCSPSLLLTHFFTEYYGCQYKLKWILSLVSHIHIWFLVHVGFLFFSSMTSQQFSYRLSFSVYISNIN